ncbi:MAG: hypothetical protein AAFQ64_20300 [Pseudomonadota bacterium]
MTVLLSALLCVGIASRASAAVVDFNDVNPFSTQNFSSNGYDFAFSGTGFGYLWGGNSPNANGTNNLISSRGRTITVTQSDGGLFDFLGMDAALSWYNSQANDTIQINGTSFNITPTLSNIALSFEDVASVVISYNASNGSGAYWSGDNFVLQPASAAVPLPGGFPLLVTALLGGAVVSRTAKRAKGQA